MTPLSTMIVSYQGATQIYVVEKTQNLLIFQYCPGPLTKFQYIQGLEFLLSNSSIFQVFQDVYEPCDKAELKNQYCWKLHLKWSPS